MSTGKRFRQDRKDWATTADQLSFQCYRDFFGLEEEDIYEVETLVDNVHDRSEGYKTHQILDYGGLDRIIDCSDRHVHISERIRPDGELCDLSLRGENGVDGRHPELTKWITAYETFGYYPSVISFGRYDHDAAMFSEFYLLETEVILAAIVGEDTIGETIPTGDGTEAMYIPTDELQDIGAVIVEWEDVTPNSDPDDGDDVGSPGAGRNGMVDIRTDIE
jgi:hypothetical protein